jgi:hypothetical protein
MWPRTYEQRSADTNFSSRLRPQQPESQGGPSVRPLEMTRIRLINLTLIRKTNSRRKSEQQPESKSRKKSTAKASQDKDPGCEACGGNHNLNTCYYAFPSKAPSWFKGNPVIRDAVTYRLQQDRSLINKVTALKESAGPAESD